MRNILYYTDFLIESTLELQPKFLTIVEKISKSNNPIVAEVANLLLESGEFHSIKFKKNFYQVDVLENDLVIFNNQQIKLGKLLVSFFPTVKLFKIEQFVQVFKSILSNSVDSYRLEIYRGEQIVQGYLSENYAANYSGDLHSSCMNDKEAYLELYTKNKNISLAVCLNNDNKICARTLLWHTEENTNLYDRVYSLNAETKEILVNLLKKQNYVQVNTNFLQSVKLDYLPMEFPYVDTFCYLDTDAMTLNLEHYDGCYILHMTNGEYLQGDDNEIYDDTIDVIETNIPRTITYLIRYDLSTVNKILTGLVEETNDITKVVNSTRKVLTEEYISYTDSYAENCEFLRTYLVTYLKKINATFKEKEPIEDLIAKAHKLTSEEDTIDFILEEMISATGLHLTITTFHEFSSDDNYFLTSVLEAENNLYAIARHLASFMDNIERNEFRGFIH